MATKEEWAFATAIKACSRLLSCAFADTPLEKDIAVVWGVRRDFIGKNGRVSGKTSSLYVKSIRARKRKVPRVLIITNTVTGGSLIDDDIREFLAVLSKTLYLLAGTPAVIAKRVFVRRNYFVDKSIDRGSRFTSILREVKLLLGELQNPRPEYYIK
jgi:hypothetical protein